MPKRQHAATYKPIPELLRAMRQEAGLSQQALAERMGLWQTFVFKSEAGERRVDIVEYVQWAAACGVAAEHAFRRLLDENKWLRPRVWAHAKPRQRRRSQNATP